MRMATALFHMFPAKFLLRILPIILFGAMSVAANAQASIAVQSTPFTGISIAAYPPDMNGASGGITNFSLNYSFRILTVTLTAPASVNGNPFSNWVINGVAQPAGVNTYTGPFSGNSTAVAVYAIPNYTLSIQSQNPGSGVAISASPADAQGLTGGTTAFSLTYPNNTVVSLTAPSTVGNNPFLYWTINGVNQAAGVTTVRASITGNSTAVAVYQPTNVMTVQSQNPSAGVAITNTPSDNRNVSSGNTQYTLIYNTGSRVSLTAPAVSGLNKFANWTIDGVAQQTGVTTVATTVNADTTLVAVYAPAVPLSVQSQNPSAGVAISNSPADNTGITSGVTSYRLQYSAGTSVTLTAPAKQGNNPFQNWVINGTVQAAGATTVTFTHSAPETAVAVYQPTNVVTVQSQNPSSGVPITNTPADNQNVSSGNTQYTLIYNTGSRVSLTAPAVSGLNKFANWTVDGVAQAAGVTTVTTTVSADTVLVAVYSPAVPLSVQSQNPSAGVAISNSPADNTGIASGVTSYRLQYSAGTSVTLTAPPKQGNNPFLNWVINGTVQAAGATTVTFTHSTPETAVAVYQATSVLNVQSQNPSSGVNITSAPADEAGLTSGATQFNLNYPTDTPITVTAPSTSGGNNFSNWTINGVAQPPGQTSISFTITADTTVQATYVTPNYAVNVQSQNPSSGVSVTNAPADNGGLTTGQTSFVLSYPARTQVTLTAPASIKNAPLLYWTVNGVNQAAGATATTFTVNGPITAVAVYQATNVVTVQSVNPGSGVQVAAAPNDNAGTAGGSTQFALTYNTGTSITLTAPTTAGGNVFANWTINGVAQTSGQNGVTFPVNGDSTAVAVYQTPNYAVSVQSQNPTSGVTVTAAPADNGRLTSGSTTFTLSYPAHIQVTLTAPAKSGNNPFLYWVVNGVNQAAGATSTTFTVNGPVTAVAVYQATNVLTVQSVNPASGVAVSSAPNDNAGLSGGNTQFSLVYNTGTAITLTAPAAAGKNNFANWTVNGLAQPAGQLQLKLTLTGDTTVAAVYNTPTYTVTSSALGSHGTIAPNGVTTLLLGANQNFTATPAQGYAISQWTMDGAVVQTGGTTFQITNIQANHVLQVSFAVVMVYHPADTNKDAKMSIKEVTAYGAAWQRGLPWPNNPSPIPQAFVTNAVLLWKSGELYTYDPSKADPTGWIPPSQAPFAASSAVAVGGVPLVCHVTKQADGTWLATVVLQPPSGAHAITLEEHLPTNAQLLGFSTGGFIDQNTHTLRFGPFMDASARSFSFRLRLNGTGAISGEASFDGHTTKQAGDKLVGAKG